jgi:phage terminase large subunit
MLGLLRDPLANAVCFRRYSNELRDTVYGQMNWSIGKIGAEDYFVMGVNPMQILYKPTGQKIMFKGADNPHKLKSLNIGKGYVKYALFEEVDQYAAGVLFEMYTDGTSCKIIR